jgi:hypothetical protein
VGEATIKWRADRTISEMTNVMPLKQGGFQGVNLPINAVLVQIVEGVDDDEGPTYSTMTSIVCVDERMKPTLEAYARRIIEAMVDRAMS